MDFPDLRTIIFSYIITDIISTIVVVLLWLQSRKRFRGAGYWVVDFVFQTVALLLIIARGHIPDWLSMVVSNTMVVAGMLLGYIGLAAFLNRRVFQYYNYMLLAVFPFIHLWFTYSDPDLSIRTLNISVAMLVLFLQCSWISLRGLKRGDAVFTAGAGTVFAGFSVITALRIFEFFIGDHVAKDFFHSGYFNALIILSYQMLFIALTYTLVLMFNKRLLSEIALQEDKFSKAFHTSAYAITLTRMSDGRIIEVNDGFSRITGFSAGEVIGKTTLELGLFEKDEDRQQILSEIIGTGTVQGRENRFRKKSGEIITGLLSVEIIMINNDQCLLSSINDITERKQDEQKIRVLLKEKELLLKEVHHRIKNNMNTIFGLLMIQADEQDSVDVRNRLMDAAGRVQSMSVLYDKLYRLDYGDSISIRDYIPPLAEEIIRIFNYRSPVRIITELEDVILQPKLLSPLGIIINEFITNTMKYAFAENGTGVITIRGSLRDSILQLSYEDNGKGLADDFSLEGSSGFGLKLVDLLIQEMGGAFSFSRDSGTRFLISISV